MAGSQHGRGADQVSLRLPPGLRDRIKAYADQEGRSMNAEIVRVLEKEFPEPWSIETRVEYLFDLFSALRKVRGHDGAIDGLTNLMLETVEGIASGRAPEVDEETRAQIAESLNSWHERVLRDDARRADQLSDPE